MRHGFATTFAIVSMLAMLVAAPSAVAAPRAHDTARDRLDVYSGKLTREQLASIVALGVDRTELEISRAAGSRGGKALVRVEAILSASQVNSLKRRGIELDAKKVGGATVAQRATARAAAGLSVFKKYSGPGGLKEELEQVASENRGIAELVTIGQSLDGQDIVALKVSRNARARRKGRKPAVLYLGAQHAREWITPEMVRRLMHHVIDNYRTDRQIRRLVNTRELWFVPVANPDGYDWTFEPGQRLWRKNLRDNNGDGQITAGDGVDLNRNFPTKWGYDNEGSSPNPASETYRGTGPSSEPETRAIDAIGARIGFEFLVNYHSAAELLLYGTGWQVATPTPDDVIYEAMAGDDAHPAVPGYDPDISAELYTTNGDTDTDLTERYGTLGFTPEMSTCQTASDSVPDDEWDAEDCGSVFEFPDDEQLVQAEFEKNLPFALSVAESAGDPDDPESVVGREAEDFRVDSFDVSYGDPQTVAVVAKRALRRVAMHYRINGGRERIIDVSEWRGGERYGDENNDYYAELRGRVRGADAGDEVEVWFSGHKRGARPSRSERFTYKVALETAARVLVIANEDYTGVNPDYPPGTDAPKYADEHLAAVEAAGYDADLWDVDKQGVPHDLGVLSHYDAVVWYLGDNRLTQDPEDEIIVTALFGELTDIAVAERQQYLTMTVRAYLNEGGKLIHAGETAQYQGQLDFVGGLYYGLNGDPSAECAISSDQGLFNDCLILADDFSQYYLGAYRRASTPAPDSVDGISDPIAGYKGKFGGPVIEGDNPLDEAGAFVPTSDVLPVDEFPQFASHGAAKYNATRFEPIQGERYAGALHADESYMRLSKTVDLTSASNAQLQFQLSADTEPGFDHVIVEAHTVGQDNWTTLPDLNGGTSTDPPAQCAAGFLLAMHPLLGHYLGGDDCTDPGSTGTWNAFTGSSGGWQEVAFDLSGFAGGQVEVAITYVTDPSSGGIGAFVDDTRVVVDGATTSADDFEGATSTWTVGGPPEGSPGNLGDWEIGGLLFDPVAGTATDDTLLLGFGLEQLATDEDRNDLMQRALTKLIG